VDIGEKRAGKRGKDMEKKGKGKGKEVKRKEIKWPKLPPVKIWQCHCDRWDIHLHHLHHYEVRLSVILPFTAI